MYKSFVYISKRTNSFANSSSDSKWNEPRLLNNVTPSFSFLIFLSIVYHRIRSFPSLSPFIFQISQLFPIPSRPPLVSFNLPAAIDPLVDPPISFHFSKTLSFPNVSTRFNTPPDHLFLPRSETPPFSPPRGLILEAINAAHGSNPLFIPLATPFLLLLNVTPTYPSFRGTELWEWPLRIKRQASRGEKHVFSTTRNEFASLHYGWLRWMIHEMVNTRERWESECLYCYTVRVHFSLIFRFVAA